MSFASQRSAALADPTTGKVAETITATSEHPFFVEGRGWVELGQVGIGSEIVTRAGPKNLVVQSVSRSRHSEGVAVYNFEVEGTHTYFVGNARGGAWVHNTCSSGTAVPRKPGTYLLLDPGTDQIVRTGRTSDLFRRRGEHALDPELKDFEFMLDMEVPYNMAALRGREQMIYDHIAAPYNKIRGISPRNPRRAHYMSEGAKLGTGPLGF
ncbi:MAG TPA: polymorphic toxin-type HINT domain-containing protein [Armatimonadaceae bacterium]|nr:polymorphic toxin-type HINT domain-containing protein [Armatimonadaceae bacterium]